MEHRLDALDALLHDGSVGDRADDPGRGRRQEVEAERLVAHLAEAAHEGLAEVARAPRHEDFHSISLLKIERLERGSDTG